jgi:hypothetical protein
MKGNVRRQFQRRRRKWSVGERLNLQASSPLDGRRSLPAYFLPFLPVLSQSKCSPVSLENRQSIRFQFALSPQDISLSQINFFLVCIVPRRGRVLPTPPIQFVALLTFQGTLRLSSFALPSGVLCHLWRIDSLHSPPLNEALDICPADRPNLKFTRTVTNHFCHAN